MVNNLLFFFFLFFFVYFCCLVRERKNNFHFNFIVVLIHARRKLLFCILVFCAVKWFEMKKEEETEGLRVSAKLYFSVIDQIDLKDLNSFIRVYEFHLSCRERL